MVRNQGLNTSNLDKEPPLSTSNWNAHGRNGPPVALSIAGFDPSSGAGVTADLQTFASHGVFGTCAITALTVQSTLGVEAVEPVAPELLRRMLECLTRDLPAQGIKLGMLGDLGPVVTVADYLKQLHEAGVAKYSVNKVFDPVLRASSGTQLTPADSSTLGAIHERLLPLVTWITPNWQELQRLSGVEVVTAEDAEEAAAKLGARHPHLHIVVTGGDQTKPQDLLRLPDGTLHRFAGEHIETRSTHGTGCAFSAALLCGLILGREPVGAVRAAKEFVAQALRRAPGLGHGRGPLDLLWPLRQP